MIGFALGMLYANAGEWLMHKYVLHGPGKHRGSFWSFHFHEHHRAARREDMMDESYKRPVWFGGHAQSKEAWGLVAMSIAHAPLCLLAPGFVAAIWFSAGSYYYVHRKAHEQPDWGREHLPWHYDHHMGPDQDQNWCVTWPWFDWVMGTRVKYVGTEREAADMRRRERIRQRRKAS